MAVLPHATDDNFTFNENQTMAGNLLANDTPGSSGLFLRFFDGVRVNAKGSLDQVTDIAGDYGVFHVKPDGSFSYDLYDWARVGFTAGESYVETLKYKVSDGLGNTDQGVFKMTINGVTNNPIAVDDTFSFGEHDAISGNVLANDIKGDYTDNLYLRSVDDVKVAASGVTDIAGAYGVFHMNANGDFTYDLNADVADGQTVTEVIKYYKISDGLGHTDVGVLTLNIHGDILG